MLKELVLRYEIQSNYHIVDIPLVARGRNRRCYHWHHLPYISIFAQPLLSPGTSRVNTEHSRPITISEKFRKTNQIDKHYMHAITSFVYLRETVAVINPL